MKLRKFYGRLAKRVIGHLLVIVMGCVIFQSFGGAHPVPQAPSQLRITSEELPDAVVGEIYSALIKASGGKVPYEFSATGLPDGLAIRGFSDRLSGMATTVGSYSVEVMVTDSGSPNPSTASRTLKLNVVAPPK